MSRQLALSASFSIFAMAVFALGQSAPDRVHHASIQTGAAANATAPAFAERLAPLFPFLID